MSVNISSMHRSALFPALILFILPALPAQNLYFPPTSGDEWETISPDELGWNQVALEDLLDFVDQADSRAFMVLVDGKIVVEEYFHGFDRDSIWYWASAGKGLTAFLTGIAQSEGLLSIDDPVSNWLGEGWTSAPPEKEAQITVENQLNMTTGLDYTGEDLNCTLDTCLRYLNDAGSAWYYHNAPYTLIASVLEEASGQNLNGFLFNRLSNQTGIYGLYYRIGYNRTMFSTPRNFARFGLLMLADGVWDGVDMLGDDSYFQKMINPSQEFNKSYGYLWWLNGKESIMVPGQDFVLNTSLAPNAPEEMYAALGRDGQILQVIPSLNMVLMRMGDVSDNVAVPFTFSNEIWEYMNKVIATDVEDVVEEGGFSIAFPNPSSAVFKLNQTALPSDFEYRLFHSDGRLLKFGRNIERIDLSMESRGVYLLQIVSERGVFTEKLIRH